MSAAASTFTRSPLVRRVRTAARAHSSSQLAFADDLRLFATTFGAGFLFVTLFLA